MQYQVTYERPDEEEMPDFEDGKTERIRVEVGMELIYIVSTGHQKFQAISTSYPEGCRDFRGADHLEVIEQAVRHLTRSRQRTR